MSLIWSPDWRAKYFGLAPHRLPVGFRSNARIEWDQELERAEAADAARERQHQVHVQKLVAEAREAEQRPMRPGER